MSDGASEPAAVSGGGGLNYIAGFLWLQLLFGSPGLSMAAVVVGILAIAGVAGYLAYHYS